MSYARVDDEYEDGRVSQLRQRLSGAVRAQTGDVFPRWRLTGGVNSSGRRLLWDLTRRR
jgi:hypothetical protein